METLACFYCLLAGHWAEECPDRVKAASRKEHEDRIQSYIQRMWDGRLTPRDKQKLIRQENDLWNRKEAA